MQTIAPVTAPQLQAATQTTLLRFEIYDGANWQDISALGGKNYLKSVTVQLGGAGASPDPIAASWNAEVFNEGGIFHPFHPTSAYKAYFRVGRQVRISYGGIYGGTPYYWQRLIGFMDEPKFNAEARTVSISGSDYMKYLTDTTLRSPNNYWGTTATFSSVATVATYGSELYTEGDALDINSEANNMTNWVAGGVNISTYADAGAGSTWAGVFQKPAGSSYGFGYNTNVATLEQGKEYELNFYWKRTAGSGTLTPLLYFSAGGDGWQVIRQSGITGTVGTWYQAALHGKAIQSGVVGLEFRIDGTAGEIEGFRIDQVSIREVTSKRNARYPMPVTCNDVYYATLDGTPLWYGDNNRGWFFDQANKVWYFDDNMWILTGSSNIVVYYFTTQSIVNVLGDILAASGLYATRAAALAAMNYTDPSVTIPDVWFEAGATALACIQKCCERVNYRFWFGYDGTPHFSPAPTVGAVSATLGLSDASAVSDYQDLTEIKNAVTIQGIELGAFSTADNKVTSRITSTATDPTSIAAYLENDLSITNDLFQTQAATDAMVATLLAAYKDPRWYAELAVPFNPIPLELGDTVIWTEPLSLSQLIVATGIIRDISLDASGATYKCEVTSYVPAAHLSGAAATTSVGTLTAVKS